MKINSNINSTAAKSRRTNKKLLPLTIFLLPTIIILILFAVYPIIYTIIRSFYGTTGDFIGLGNYQRILNEPRMLVALRNNAIWVAIVPITITFLGLVLAVLTQKIKWSAAFKVILFMPLVVSGLAAGVTFRFMYASDPGIGFINAVSQSVVHVFRPPGLYPGARISGSELLAEEDGTIKIPKKLETGSQANFPLLAIRPQFIPEDARDVQLPEQNIQGISGAVWLDIKRGGIRGKPEEGKSGLPAIRVEALQDGKVVATAYTDTDGSYSLSNLQDGEYTIRLNEANFRKPFGGFYWLGRDLIIPSLIFAYIWISTGLSLIIIGAGLSSINKDFLDAARIAGANEFKVFFYITMPMLSQVLIVVFVRTVISVLKIFDLVMVVAPESVQADATVLALEMWRAAFGGMRDFGLGSALATVLFLLILPVVISNVRRFRFEQ